MKKLSKYVSLVLSVMMMVALLAACGSKEEAPAEEEPVAPSMEETDKLFMGRM